VAEGERGRVYLPPTQEMEEVARRARPEWRPESPLPPKALGFSIQLYIESGTYGDLFTQRQLVALTTLSDLTRGVRERVCEEAMAAGMSKEDRGLAAGGSGAVAYADAVSVYLGLGVSKLGDYNASLVQWSVGRDQAVHVFGRQALPM